MQAVAAVAVQVAAVAQAAKVGAALELAVLLPLVLAEQSILAVVAVVVGNNMAPEVREAQELLFLNMLTPLAFPTLVVG
jgi:hypothetical protein